MGKKPSKEKTDDSNEPKPVAEQIEKLRKENERLLRQLSIERSVTLEAKSDQLTDSEVETIRAIFDVFDTDKNGKISVVELQNLHSKLGEPITDAEAAQAVAEMDPRGSKEVDFQHFLKWWSTMSSHKQTVKGYMSRFQLLNAKIIDDFKLENVVKKGVGELGSLEYRVVFHYKEPNGSLKPISPWHDIPLHAVGKNADAKIFNFVCEIPKWTRAKYEIATDEPFNPIKQDVQHGKPRFYKYGDMMFNYGAFPRTWEDPHHVPDDTKLPGDNDPLDVVEIGTRKLETGSIVPVKVLGVLALIDDGETDWKIIAIAISDPLAHLLNDIDDVDREIPGAIDAARDYFRLYKTATGKPENSFALRGQAMPRQYAVNVVEQCHKFWETLYNVQHMQTVVKGGIHVDTPAPTSPRADENKNNEPK